MHVDRMGGELLDWLVVRSHCRLRETDGRTRIVDALDGVVNEAWDVDLSYWNGMNDELR